MACTHKSSVRTIDGLWTEESDLTVWLLKCGNFYVGNCNALAVLDSTVWPWSMCAETFPHVSDFKIIWVCCVMSNLHVHNGNLHIQNCSLAIFSGRWVRRLIQSTGIQDPPILMIHWGSLSGWSWGAECKPGFFGVLYSTVYCTITFYF